MSTTNNQQPTTSPATWPFPSIWKRDEPYADLFVYEEDPYNDEVPAWALVDLLGDEGEVPEWAVEKTPLTDAEVEEAVREAIAIEAGITALGAPSGSN